MCIEDINNYLKENLWMDFEVVKVGMNCLELHGFIDEAYDDDIIIRFESVYMLSLVTSFSYKGGKDFISIVSGDKEREISIKYNVSVGNKIFLLSNTSIDSEMIIIAKDVEMDVIN